MEEVFKTFVLRDTIGLNIFADEQCNSICYCRRAHGIVSKRGMEKTFNTFLTTFGAGSYR